MMPWRNAARETDMEDPKIRAALERHWAAWIGCRHHNIVISIFFTVEP